MCGLRSQDKGRPESQRRNSTSRMVKTNRNFQISKNTRWAPCGANFLSCALSLEGGSIYFGSWFQFIMDGWGRTKELILVAKEQRERMSVIAGFLLPCLGFLSKPQPLGQCTTCRLGLPRVVNSIWKDPPRYTKRWKIKEEGGSTSLTS